MAQKKRLRVSQACDFCSRRSIRCQGSSEDTAKCQNCVDFDIPCTYDRPKRKRGQKKHDSPDKREHSEGASIMSDLQQPDVSDPSDQAMLGRAWKAFAIASEGQINDMMGVFFEIVYPIFPWFHRPTLLAKLARREHMHSRGFFASVMAACALVASRIRDGALSWRQKIPYSLEAPSSEAYANAAKDAIPKDLTRAAGTDFLRAVGLLALTSLQDNHMQGVHYFIGVYHTLSALDSFADEDQWPKVSVVELEERRCLFWSFYTFEVYTSIIWGGIIRNRESQCHVYYPSMIDREKLTKDTTADANSWLVGWNFVTDMYRLLEHAVDHYRSNRSQLKPVLGFKEAHVPNTVILERVNALYAELPQHFKDIPPMTEQGNILGFQATNISAALALVKIVVFASERGAAAERRCDVAEELLAVFSKIPLTYSKSMGSPLVHHLSGIGSILGSAIENPLSDASYRRVKPLILQMASLLESLESGTHRGGAASERVRSQLQRLDQFVSGESQHRARQPLPAHVQPPTPAGANTPGGASSDFDNLLLQFPQDLMEWPWSMNPAAQADSIMPPIS